MKNKEILSLIRKHPRGISVKDIHDALSISISLRSLQRQIRELIDAGELKTEGKGPAVVYRLASDEIPADSPAPSYSAEAKHLKQKIHLDLSKRKSAGYIRGFLYDYKPNEDFYLSSTQRTHLQQMGQQDGEKAAGTFARTILSRLLIDLSWNSSRLEGNTYSLLETQRLLVLGKEATQHTSFEAQMILNHKAAIEFLVEQGEALDINRFTLLNLHALLADNLLNNPESIGRIRKIPVAIGKTTYSPLNIPQVLEENFNYIIDTANKITDPFEQAFFLMVQLPYLQPFEDINKRVSRLTANIPFIKNNYCPLSFVELSDRDYIDGILGIYELNDISAFRDMFVWSYECSVKRYVNIRENVTEPDSFKLHYREEIRELVSTIVKNNIQADTVSNYINQWITERIPEDNQNRFKEIIESELINLREGNIVRYRISLKEFQRWYELWCA